MRYLTLIILLIFLTPSTIKAQNSKNNKRSKLIINLLVDSNPKIMIENKSANFDEISKEVKKIIYAAPVFDYDGVEYRVFGDVSLALAIIMDVEDEMFKAFSNENTKRKRYILNIKKTKLDNPNWTSQLHKLDLKALED